ncbi:MAG: hypothetical protein IJV14_16455 [Lachnospiraceae bacterium]|nr:hypothetical protein [Lachnospiraceae bacterium]
MIGRQVILTNREFTLEELYDFMRTHWDVNEGGEFVLGRPTKASIEEYILLPATRRFMTIVYPRKAGGLFSKDNKVILSTADTPEGAFEGLAQAIPTGKIFIGAAQMVNLSSSEKERKGPAEDILQRYTAYMKKLLGEAGYLKG